MSNHHVYDMSEQPTLHQQLKYAVSTARLAFNQAVAALDTWENRAENHVYTTIEQACTTLEGRLCNQAETDCEGSYNCGQEEYTQECYVGTVKYRALLACEYNRHDKTYYYLEKSVFDIKPVL
jgi:hypothetical protein